MHGDAPAFPNGAGTACLDFATGPRDDDHGTGAPQAAGGVSRLAVARRAAGEDTAIGTDCIFCGIVAGDAPASHLIASARAIAFLDILPVGPGHALVIPRRHAVGLADLEDDEGSEMFQLGRRIAAAQRDLGLADGVNLFLADGEVAGQEVFHAHLHVLARRADDGMRLQVDYPPQPSREQLDATAADLRGLL